jgi:hypothetical protein
MVLDGNQRNNISMRVLTSRVSKLENVKGVDRLHNVWAYKALWVRIGHWTFRGLNFEFLLSLVLLFMLMVTWGLLENWRFWRLRTFVDTHFWSKGDM